MADPLRESSHCSSVSRPEQPVEQSIAPGAGEELRELSGSEALQAACLFFKDFDRRVANQSIVHEADRRASRGGVPRESGSEAARESGAGK